MFSVYGMLCTHVRPSNVWQHICSAELNIDIVCLVMCHHRQPVIMLSVLVVGHMLTDKTILADRLLVENAPLHQG